MRLWVYLEGQGVRLTPVRSLEMEREIGSKTWAWLAPEINPNARRSSDS